MKPLKFIGTSEDDLAEFPKEATNIGCLTKKLGRSDHKEHLRNIMKQKIRDYFEAI